MKRVAVIGGGPAGLMAAEALIRRNAEVHLFEAKPSLGRKFLMAGKSGLNITHSEPFAAFIGRFGAATPWLLPALEAFTPDDIRRWASDLGIETFIGSSGRVFPADFKAAPLLRAWLKRLRAQGLAIHVR
ncbi:MAG TPA: NAD(P)/FAD-dependent oxidoreductase, partial [Parvibaculum sp.]|uniref:FAD-dependent oxidoreductase n=1 Tax=Parvibaculum sp. TaxID=2024848 RepID=UPI002C0E6567